MGGEIMLKPCPFCGGEAEIRHLHAYGDWEVTICCAEKNRCYIHPETDRYPDETYELALKGAAEEWNTRT